MATRVEFRTSEGQQGAEVYDTTEEAAAALEQRFEEYRQKGFEVVTQDNEYIVCNTRGEVVVMYSVVH